MLGTLRPGEREQVSLLVQEEGPEDRLGQRTSTWVVGAIHSASVQPPGLDGAAEAVQAGLSVDRDRLRIRVFPAPSTDPERLRLRGRDWKVLRVERWFSYLLLIVEGV